MVRIVWLTIRRITKLDLGVEGLTNERGPENEHQKKKKKSIIVRVIVFPGCKC